jgi:chromosome condensin MukBEF ATPase and DNA-binding subunit MukB
MADDLSYDEAFSIAKKSVDELFEFCLRYDIEIILSINNKTKDENTTAVLGNPVPVFKFYNAISRIIISNTVNKIT